MLSTHVCKSEKQNGIEWGERASAYGSAAWAVTVEVSGQIWWSAARQCHYCTFKSQSQLTGVHKSYTVFHKLRDRLSRLWKSFGSSADHRRTLQSVSSIFQCLCKHRRSELTPVFVCIALCGPSLIKTGGVWSRSHVVLSALNRGLLSGRYLHCSQISGKLRVWEAQLTRGSDRARDKKMLSAW